MDSPTPALTPTVVPLYASARGKPDTWQFRGTAFFINPTMLLTARHVVDDTRFYEENGGTLTFAGEDNDTRWAIGLDRGKNKPPRLSAKVVGRHPNCRMDVALLEVSEPLPADPHPVIWLEQITQDDWDRWSMASVKFEVEAFPASYIAPEISEQQNPGAPVGDATKTGLSLANPKILAPGLLAAKIPDGGVYSGESGGPLFLRSAFGPFCLGIAKLGAESAGNGTFLGEGSILPWLGDLKEPKVQFQSVRPGDLLPEDLAAYLDALRRRTRTMLAPILGAAALEDAQGASNPAKNWRMEHSEEKFIRLFICLHARPDGAKAQKTLRADAIEELYEEVRADCKRSFDLDLPPYADAAREPTVLGGRVVHVVQLALEHVISLAEGEDDPREPDTTGPSDWEHNLLLGCCAHLKTQVASGRRQLEHRDHVWNALQSASRVVIASPAGGGKSTVAMFLALALSKPCLPPTSASSITADKNESKPVALRRFVPNLRGRLPVYIRLREFRHWDFSAPQAKARAQAIDKLVCYEHDSDTAQRVNSQCAAGKAFLILDGLDELDGADRQQMFCQCLEAWLAQNRETSVLVTTRPTAYPPADPETATPSWQLEEFALWHMEKLHPTQQREFLESWFDESPETADNVFNAIRDRQLTDLSEDPLLLAALARLAARRLEQDAPMTLPDTKVAVFDEIIMMMLTTWEAVRADEPHSALETELCRWHLNPKEVREILARLALLSLAPSGEAAQTHDSDRVAGRARLRRMDISRKSLEDELERLIRTKPPVTGRPADGARTLVDLLSKQSGLIRPFETGPAHKRVSMLEFPIRSYRNYLAGEALFKRLPSSASPAAKAAFQDRPVAFAAFCIEHGLAPILGLTPEDPPVNPSDQAQTFALALARLVAVDRHRIGPLLDEFLQRIRIRQSPGAEQTAFGLIQAAVTLALDVKAWRADPSPGPQRLITGASGDIPDWQELLSHAVHSPVETLADRATAASLGGLLSEPPELSRPSPVDWRPVGADGRLRFCRGDDAEWGGGGPSPCDLVRHAFYMSAYPVTVDDYGVFVHATSSDPPAAFTGELRLARTNVFRTPNHPVVGVSWTEARRYCAWLTGEMRDGRLAVPIAGKNRSLWEIRLPEEWEWELAARGPMEDEQSRPSEQGEWFRVPWGWATADEIRRLANCDRGLKGTSAVKLFGSLRNLKGNVSPFGIVDLVGNVWEWCQTPWAAEDGGRYATNYERELQEAEKKPGSHRVVRGGGWNHDPASCRCACRNVDHPDRRSGSLGFRLVLAPVPPEASGARVV